MNILYLPGSQRIVALLGKGLIGDSIYQRLLREGWFNYREYKTDWSSIEQARSLAQEVITLCNIKGVESSLTIIWSAGKAGFNASSAQTNHEFTFFEEFCRQIKKDANLLNNKIRFFLFSSIGGLFEGQTNITKNSIPYPLRAYGKLKLAQEQLVFDLFGDHEPTVFRPSSVYGYINNERRMGLIQVMLRNGLLQLPTSVFGNIDTLRDYIFSDDIATVVVKLVAHTASLEHFYHLVSGKPCSILEIKQIIESILRKRIYVTFVSFPDNTRDIVCCPDQVNQIWNPDKIKFNIQRIRNAWFDY